MTGRPPLGRLTIPGLDASFFEDRGAATSSTGRYTRASRALRTLSLALSMLSKQLEQHEGNKLQHTIEPALNCSIF